MSHNSDVVWHPLLSYKFWWTQNTGVDNHCLVGVPNRQWLGECNWLDGDYPDGRCECSYDFLNYHRFAGIHIKSIGNDDPVGISKSLQHSLQVLKVQIVNALQLSNEMLRKLSPQWIVLDHIEQAFDHEFLVLFRTPSQSIWLFGMVLLEIRVHPYLDIPLMGDSKHGLLEPHCPHPLQNILGSRDGLADYVKSLLETIRRDVC